MSKSSKSPKLIDPLITECALKIQRQYDVEAKRMVKAVELYQSHSLIQLKSTRLDFPSDRWDVISQSDASKCYHIDMHNLTCTCEDFKEQTEFHAPDEAPICKHIASILLKLKVDAERERLADSQLTWQQSLDTMIRRAGLETA